MAAIEVDARRAHPLGMTPAAFLRDYWQKQPLLVRGAFSGYQAPLTPDDLAGLACEEFSLARLVERDPVRDEWRTRAGPFAESDFAALPASHWTLLVQDVDKWDADLATLIARFDFLPRWRIDDVMVSYAVDGGGVGPHIDQYDVFLLQASGRRRWRITTDPAAPTAFRSDVELKLLRQFEPTHDWTLEPGDMLYLPPGVPHEGTAVGECMTFSLGMRAPSCAELIVDFAESIAEPLGEERRYRDPDLAPARDANEIDAAAIERVAHALAALRDVPDAELGDWFGRFITRYRAAQIASPPDPPVTSAMLERALGGGAEVLRHPFTRFAWLRDKGGATVFAAGQPYRTSLAFARTICATACLDASELGDLSARDRTALLGLLNEGHLVLTVPRKGRRR